jgi:hypothetical protein
MAGMVPGSRASGWPATRAGRRPRSRRLLAVAAIALTAVSGCGRSQEAEVRAAIRERFAAGPRRCLGLAGDVVDIHVDPGRGGTFYYPSAGITSPLRHAYVFYAARDGAPVPELVRELVGLGLLHETVVTAAIDVESTGVGPRLVSASVHQGREQWFRHDTRAFPVAIYATAPQDGRFEYETRRTQSGRPFAPPGFPSRMYADPLPPPDRHYVIPIVEPYALGIVKAACFPETVGAVGTIRKVTSWGGDEFVHADVAFEEHPLAWMSSPAFRRAAIGSDTPSLTAPRRAVVSFREVAGKLTYVSEVAQ